MTKVFIHVKSGEIVIATKYKNYPFYWLQLARNNYRIEFSWVIKKYFFEIGEF